MGDTVIFVERPVEQKYQVRVAVCTSAEAFNVQGFIDELNNCTDLVKEAYHLKLPYNDLDKFTINDEVEAVILCHSINNRRFAITDVMDALYDKFLPKTAKILGKEKVGVIVHDMPSDQLKPFVHETQMSSFRMKQPTTFLNASLVLIAGNLENSPVDLKHDDWQKIKKFLRKLVDMKKPQEAEQVARRKQERLLEPWPVLGLVFMFVAGLVLIIVCSLYLP